MRTNGKEMAPPSQPASAAMKNTKAGDKRASPADSEAAMIRQRYMGADQNQSTFSAKKKRRRTTEKKFNFEWNAEEDTSIDHNPIYADRIEANFYGRGHLGGLDVDTKTQDYARALQQRDGQDGSKRAQEMLEMERQRKAGSRRAALDMHWTEKKLEDMRERDWRIFKEDFSISTKGGGIPNPMRKWSESHLPSQLLRIVDEVGYKDPSPVQRAAIPIALQSRDLIGIAVTGSGKTAAFLLPLLTYITELPPLDKDNRLVDSFHYCPLTEDERLHSLQKFHGGLASLKRRYTARTIYPYDDHNRPYAFGANGRGSSTQHSPHSPAFSWQISHDWNNRSNPESSPEHSLTSAQTPEEIAAEWDRVEAHLTNDRQDGPYAIILAPTRELAQQIELEAKKFATPLGFKCVSIVGGHSIEEQVNQLQKGAEIVIATPGRLVDCIERRVLMLNQCCYVIMDEADRMIDLGFEEPVNKILDALPVKNAKPDSDDAEDPGAMKTHLGETLRYRQTMMYTATMPSAVERIARKYLRRPAIVTIGNVGEAVDTVEQRVEFVSDEDKRKKRLGEILNSHEFAPPIIVFVNIKRNCDTVARDIKHMGFSSVTLHGSKTQDQREAALASIRNGTTQVLVATDLAGRGIDVIDVSLVVNFNMATNIESYTHRIGRTGRAGKSGTAITFLGNEDADVMYDLKQMLTKSEISRVPEELRKHEAAQQKSARSGGVKKVEESSGFAGKGGANSGW